MIDKNPDKTAQEENKFQSAWQMVSASISVAGLDDSTRGKDGAKDAPKDPPPPPEEKKPGAPPAEKTPAAPAEGDPFLKLIQKEIEAHEAHDKSRSYLARAFDIVYSPDSKTLKDLKALTNEYSGAIARGDTAASEEMKQKIENKIKEDLKAVLDKSQVDQLASNFTKTMFLFINGTVGIAGTIASYSLDQMRPDSSLTEQLIDGTTGAAKGALMRAILAGIGKVEMPIAAKGLALGVSSRMLELGLNPQTYFDRENNQYDIKKGLSTTFLSSVNPETMAMDALIFTAAHGLSSAMLAGAPERISKSPLLSTVSTAYVFGATGGAVHEFNRQKANGEFDLGAIALLAARDGAISALASSIGGLQSELAWRKSNDYLFIKEGEKGQFTFEKTKYYEVKARQVTDPKGETVKTIENTNGEHAPRGSWVVERSPQERYPMKPVEFAERWQPVPGKPGVYSPRPVPTSMVELSKPVDIKTGWGDMHGKPGDFLVRYPNNTFAIIDRKVLTETYAGSNAQSAAKLKAIQTELAATPPTAGA